MSHALLFERGIPFNDPAHRQIIQERKSEMIMEHAARIRNVLLERDIVRGNYYTRPIHEGEHLIHSPLAHNIVKMGSTSLIPRDPTWAIGSLSEIPIAKDEANIALKWLHALLYNMNARLTWNALATETMFGVGGVHVLADKYADETDEIPLIFETPDSASMLYHMGPRHKVDYIFIKHMMSARDIERHFKTQPTGANSTSGTSKHEVWCYYAEERYLDPKTNKLNRMILYTVLEGDTPLFDLMDVTPIYPDIPVYLCFNQDGYMWRGAEEMHAMGILTQTQSLLLYAADMLTQTANGVIRYVDPPLVVKQDPNTDAITPNRRAGGVTELGLAESIETLAASQPSQIVGQFWPQVMEQIASATFPQVWQQMQKMDGVSGSMFSEQMHHKEVQNQVRQSAMELTLQSTVTCALRHLAAITNPKKGMVLRGVDPRDYSAYTVLMSAALLKRIQIRARLTYRTPRQVYLHVQTLENLAEKGYISREMMTEMSAELLDLPIKDMDSMLGAIADDDRKKMQLQIMQQQAMAVLPQVRQQMFNQGMSPDRLLPDGSSPIRMGSAAVPPNQYQETQQAGPVQQAADNARDGVMNEMMGF